jgi:response regulator RpfG family c-di-GMP phosphodiesterase
MLEPAVLFVDDEPNILTALQRLFRKEDFRVFTAPSGEAGLELLRATHVPVVISDYRMPAMNGVAFLAQVKQLLPDSVRVILSGFADAQVIVDAINKGEVFRFHPKPWDDQELLITIRQCLEHYHLRREHAQLSHQTRQQNEQLRQLNESLEQAVSERTRSLAFSQEVLECLPVSVIGVSREGEIVLTNECARQSFPSLASILPGTDLGEVLADRFVAEIRNCLQSQHEDRLAAEIDGRPVTMNISLLNSAGVDRGCVLLVS